MTKSKLIVGETVFYGDEYFIIIECRWIDKKRVYTLKHSVLDQVICGVEEAELLR